MKIRVSSWRAELRFRVAAHHLEMFVWNVKCFMAAVLCVQCSDRFIIWDFGTYFVFCRMAWSHPKDCLHTWVWKWPCWSMTLKRNNRCLFHLFLMQWLWEVVSNLLFESSEIAKVLRKQWVSRRCFSLLSLCLPFLPSFMVYLTNSYQNTVEIIEQIIKSLNLAACRYYSLAHMKMCSIWTCTKA